MLARTLSMIVALALAGVASADPCGMVPPLPLPDRDDYVVQRSGVQQTYAFFHDGVETIAIRPGFVGNAEQFGMLVPLPAVPALRKIDDRTFAHLAAAVDPPWVDVHIVRPRRYSTRTDGPVPSAAPEPEARGMVVRDEVRVLKEEAVGMYEVAVLEAGSARALSRWMDDHAFHYPNGMDGVVEEYVASGWLFVAIKARVGASSGVAARPGMREASHGLGPGQQFDGFVQGMAFRFEVERPVIPMRLSTFNGDDTHNRVFVLTDEPVAFAGMDRGLVRRQLSGRTVLKNLTAKLDVQVHEGTAGDIGREGWRRVELQRDPAPFNGVAKDLMAADMLAVKTGELSLPFEEREKELLRISESLSLRGIAIDDLHEEVIVEERQTASKRALGGLASLHLTVIDGDLPRDHIREHNLTLEPHVMAREFNNAESWNDRPDSPQLYVQANR